MTSHILIGRQEPLAENSAISSRSSTNYKYATLVQLRQLDPALELRPNLEVGAADVFRHAADGAALL